MLSLANRFIKPLFDFLPGDGRDWMESKLPIAKKSPNHSTCTQSDD